MAKRSRTKKKSAISLQFLALPVQGETSELFRCKKGRTGTGFFHFTPLECLVPLCLVCQSFAYGFNENFDPCRLHPYIIKRRRLSGAKDGRHHLNNMRIGTEGSQ